MKKDYYNKYKRIGILLLTLVILASSFINPIPVYATTQDRAINAEGTQLTGIYVGGLGDYTNLNSLDDDLSYIYPSPAHTGGLYHTYDMQDFVTAYASINSVTLTTRILTPMYGYYDYGKYYPVAYVGGNNYQGDLQTSYPPTWNVWITRTYTWATNPATGLAWTAAQINAAEFGFLHYGSTGTRCSYIRITVDYVPTTVPGVTTKAATDIAYVAPNHNATLNGSITDTGGSTIDYYGFIWGTSCNATVPAITEAPHNGTYGASWISGAGAYGINDYDHDLVGLLACSTYCFRFAAHNSLGWSWGSALTFVTLCDPDIITQAATYIGATTVRLNSLVINDGGQPADVRFGYSVLSGNCTDGGDCTGATCTFNATSYNGTTPWVTDTYTTGQTPYVDLSGLVSNTTYYFCVQIRNDVSCRCGGQLSFTTSTSAVVPSNLKGIPGATTLSLFWIKGVGSTNTLIRYKLNTYPTGIADGTLGYFDNKSSVTITSLLQGTTYYIRAWGESGGIYSTDNVTLMLTTLGQIADNDPLPTPSTPTNWLTAPDYTNVSNMPWYGLVNWWADSFGIQRSTLWFLSAMFISMAIGIMTYWKGGHKILLADGAVMICIGLFAAMQLTPYWLLMPFLIFAITAVAIGERI